VYFFIFFLLLLPFTVNKDVYKIPKHFFWGGEGDGGLWPFHIPLRHDWRMLAICMQNNTTKPRTVWQQAYPIDAQPLDKR